MTVTLLFFCLVAGLFNPLRHLVFSYQVVENQSEPACKHDYGNEKYFLYLVAAELPYVHCCLDCEHYTDNPNNKAYHNICFLRVTSIFYACFPLPEEIVERISSGMYLCHHLVEVSAELVYSDFVLG